MVAPFAGAWVEIPEGTENEMAFTGRSLRGSVG